ncbi:MAG: IPT/TIG domain-containing protein [Dehalococcoidia bacterium]|nr:IPT/TIG domain-containing protein [Dehalococcoidia bacterium]
MKVRAPAAILVLLSLAVCLIPTPADAVSLTLNPSRGTVGTEVTIPAICTYGEGSYYVYWGDADQLLAQGDIDESCISVTFTVPEAARGKHKVTMKVGNDSFWNEFTVVPSISLSADHGAVDSNLAVTGNGFNSSEPDITITYDGSPAKTRIAASSKGSWQSTLKVPASSRGDHIIDAEGATPATEVDDQTFRVTPSLSITPASGWVGTVISVAGTGFDSSETNITVTYDGLAAKTGITSDTTGSWQSSFSVFTSAKGSHKIDAYGAATPEADVAEVTFAVSPGIRLELASGFLGGAIRAGDSLWVSGVGFEANEAGIQVTFDGTLVVSGVIADARGSWSAQLSVPPSTSGEHTIDASGNTTKGPDVADATILISPQMEINPDAGAVGDDIVVTGTGFGGSQAITITFDGSHVSTNSTTDAKGSFTASFKIPKSKAGRHTVTIADATTSVVSTSFSVESTPPPTPQPISPEAGSRTGFVGRTTITFDWSDVEDPSGVRYLLEISQNADFSGTVIRKEDLTQTQYTLTEDEALGKGQYYWRVKAIDGADNDSDWTNGQLFKIGVMEWWVLVVSIIGGIGVIAIMWRVISISRRGSWK